MKFVRVRRCQDCPALSSLYDRDLEVCRLIPKRVVEDQDGVPSPGYAVVEGWEEIPEECPLRGGVVVLRLVREEK